jgi:hypothetical protein
VFAFQTPKLTNGIRRDTRLHDGEMFFVTDMPHHSKVRSKSMQMTFSVDLNSVERVEREFDWGYEIYLVRYFELERFVAASSPRFNF